MVNRVNTHFLPQLLDPQTLDGSTVVVIDVLRASTTIISALAAGASSVRPCREVSEALRIAGQLEPAVVLGGERNGVPIAGFHLGNSPSEYTREVVGGKNIVFTTTNGTLAMESCRLADRVLVGAFANQSAVVEFLATQPHVDLVCAGTHGEVTREDVLFAGAVVARLSRSTTTMNDASRLASDAWCNLESAPPEMLTKALRDSQGGRNLVKIGHAADIAYAAQVDTTSLIPELDVRSWQILRSPGWSH
ncbi:MAG: 2-phosphosulfolactate phosphatase [Planctomycetota bacterium]|nr:2-phosphosulfolactate phosphatase [Planctomycetota bacterium]